MGLTTKMVMGPNLVYYYQGVSAMLTEKPLLLSNHSGCWWYTTTGLKPGTPYPWSPYLPPSPAKSPQPAA